MLFWTHLICGVLAGVVILIMSVTGVALTYQRQMQLWADTRHYRADPAPDATRLDADALMAAAAAASPDESPTAITLRSDRTMPAAVAAGRRTLYLDPYDARVLGEPTGQSMRAFFSRMVSWHRYLALTGEQRGTGRALTGAANLIFLFIVLSGLYLWWPASWSWPRVRQIVWFRRTNTGRARDFNWHNVVGFWSAVPLAIVVASATVISYPWASNLVYRAAGEAPPAGRGSAPAEARPVDDAPAGEPRSLESLVQSAEARVPDWQSIAVRLPADATSPVTVSVDRGDGGQPQLRGTLTVDPRGAAFDRWDGPESQTRGRRWRSWLRFAHTGEVYGLTGQTIAGVVSAAGALLVWTGVSLAVRRFAGFVVHVRRVRRAVSVAAPRQDLARESDVRAR